MSSSVLARQATGISLRASRAPIASSSIRPLVDARRNYTPSASRRASSSDDKSPPKKKQGFFSWLRSDLTENVIKSEPTAEEVEAAKRAQEARGDANLFDSVGRVLEEQQRNEVARALGGEIPEGMSPEEARRLMKKASKPPATEHRYSTAKFKISHRKLNDLGRQISGKPVDQAILQMVFSEKRASTRIKSMLCVARDHAVDYKNLDRSKLVVSQAWVEKGPKLKRIDIKGRGRHGIKEHNSTRLRVILSHGETYEERIQREHAYKLGRIRSPGLMREDKPVRNYGPAWAW